MRTVLVALLLFAVTASAAETRAPKNIILLIADGGGTAHFTVAKQRRGAEFNIGRMPVAGLVTTHSTERTVTDSASAASTIATGEKVPIGAVSLDAKGQPLLTVLEAAEQRGKVTGVVTTAYFWDATPSAFIAHAKERYEDAPEIIRQMLRSKAEVIIGAGLKGISEPKLAHVTADAKEQGWTMVTTRAELDKAPATGRLLGVFPEQPRDVENPDAPLPVLAKLAIDRLKGHPAGFFLMIENEGVDSSSHQNFVPDLNASLTSFDLSVGVALDFAAANGDTLVVVTADHETGGLRISETKSGRPRLEWSTTDHTAGAVPVFAFGPGSATFAGFYDNTDLGKKLLSFVKP
jgi:alkaline phosphatase